MARGTQKVSSLPVSVRSQHVIRFHENVRSGGIRRGRRRPSPPQRASGPARARRGRPRWARSPRPAATRPQRDWVQISITALPSLAAVIALVFTFLSIRETDAQLQVSQQGQITDRYNSAIANLGSPSIDVRLGGIYALQRLMQDSPRDQPTVVAVLCAFVRDSTRQPPAKPEPQPKTPETDVQAALTVVVSRDPGKNGPFTVIDLSKANLSGADLTSANLTSANLASANLADANLSGATLPGADLTAANLTAADLNNADLIRADLPGADLSGADLSGATLPGADLNNANLLYADLIRADLTGASLTGASLTGASLTGASLTGAHLRGVKGLHRQG